jgi:hypothetical protein
MTRSQKFALFLTLAIVGGIGIGLSGLLAVGPARHTTPGTSRIFAGTLVILIAMAWAFYFAMRAHNVQDEFKRQREISAGYWGGWLGIAASAPIFFFIALDSFLNPATVHVAPVIVFTVGYVLSPICGGIGTVIAQQLQRHRDSRP